MSGEKTGECGKGRLVAIEAPIIRQGFYGNGVVWIKWEDNPKALPALIVDRMNDGSEEYRLGAMPFAKMVAERWNACAGMTDPVAEIAELRRKADLYDAGQALISRAERK